MTKAWNYVNLCVAKEVSCYNQLRNQLLKFKENKGKPNEVTQGKALDHIHFFAKCLETVLKQVSSNHFICFTSLIVIEVWSSFESSQGYKNKQTLSNTFMAIRPSKDDNHYFYNPSNQIHHRKRKDLMGRIHIKDYGRKAILISYHHKQLFKHEWIL